MTDEDGLPGKAASPADEEHRPPPETTDSAKDSASPDKEQLEVAAGPAASREGAKSVVTAVFGSGKFLITTVVVAVVAVAAPWIWNSTRDIVRPPVLTTATRDDAQDRDTSYAMAAAVPPERQHELPSSDAYRARSPHALSTGVKVGVLSSTVTIEGATSRNVVITNLRAEVVKEEPNLSGTLLSIPSAGNQSNLVLGFNLDEQDRSARTIKDGQLRGRYFEENSITLADGEAVVMRIEAHAKKAHYTWALQADLVIDGTPQSVRIQPPDGPFHLTGTSDRYGAVYEKEIMTAKWVHKGHKR
ncbi:hypothetical protein JOF53_001220 [Crossiella equi]|uniref:LPS export ABC transporter periplasmic protein LptC n=1 Tax=Crossiella equi TaxID=130796 RepID=A0ABS5A6X2_9PSEU|nr:hypothetical protein [Crossiella equi]MBP2472348.1 hypothetical protein [Crossiella equi]